MVFQGCALICSSLRSFWAARRCRLSSWHFGTVQQLGFVGAAFEGRASILLVVAAITRPCDSLILVGAVLQGRTSILFVIAVLSGCTTLSFLSSQPFGAARQFGLVLVRFLEAARRFCLSSCLFIVDFARRRIFVYCWHGLFGAESARQFGANAAFRAARCFVSIAAAFWGRALTFLSSPPLRLRDDSTLLVWPFGAMRCFVSIAAAFCGRASHLFVVTVFRAARPFRFVGAAFQGRAVFACHRSLSGLHIALICCHGFFGLHDNSVLWTRHFGATRCSASLPWLSRVAHRSCLSSRRFEPHCSFSAMPRCPLSSQPLGPHDAVAFVIAAFRGRTTV